MAPKTRTATTLLALKNTITPQKLHRWNRWLALLYAVQGVVILLLSTTKLFPVSTSYPTENPLATEAAGHSVLATASHHVFDLNVSYLVAAFFFIAAIAHAVLATVYRSRYEDELKKGINRIRWIDYGLSAGTMLVVIGVLSGVLDLATLIALFVFNLIMGLCGLAVEVYGQGRRQPQWLAYGIGAIAGVVPWLIIALYLWAANLYGSGAIPTYVYWICGSIFVLFVAFAVNLYLQAKKAGPWKYYLFSERTFMILSFAIKTLLAWQVFAGILRP